MSIIKDRLTKKDGNTIAPKTYTECIYDNNNNRLDDIIQRMGTNILDEDGHVPVVSGGTRDRTHPVTTNANTTGACSGTAHNNIPLYLVVYLYKRTA